MSTKQIDPILGQQVHEHLTKIGLESPIKLNGMSDTEKIDKIESLMKEVITTLEMDLEDDSLVETPKRIAKMWVNEFFAGLNYDQFPKMTCVENKMAAEDEFVCIKNIKVVSLCEHHFLPFSNFGDLPGATIAYIPNKKVLGLSKASRLLSFFAARGQVQERLTNQVLEALKFIMETDDVAIYIDSQHTCMTLRGAKDTGSTVTLATSGKFATDNNVRQEFLRIAKGN